MWLASSLPLRPGGARHTGNPRDMCSIHLDAARCIDKDAFMLFIWLFCGSGSRNGSCSRVSPLTTWAFGSSTDLLALLSRRPSHSSQLATSWFTWQRVRPEWYLCMCCMGLDVPLRASGVGNRFHVPHLMARLLASPSYERRPYLSIGLSYSKRNLFTLNWEALAGI